MKLNIFKILNKALGEITPSEFNLLYYILNGMRMSNSLELKIHRDVILDGLGNWYTARSLSKCITSLVSKDYLDVTKSRNNKYHFILKIPVPKEKEPQTRKEEYHQELEHPLWLKKRNIILERDHHQCMLCGSSTSLQVHHLRYTSGKKAWEYPNSALITLCKDCHEKVHQDSNHELNPYRVQIENEKSPNEL